MKPNLLCFVILLSLCSVSARGDVHTRLIKETAERTNKALVAGDFATVVDLTHPKLVELMGGRAKMIATIQATVAQMKGQGIAFKSASIETPADAIAAKNGQLFAIVPFSISVSIPIGIARQKSFMIASSTDKGHSWKFVDAGNVDPATLKQVLPSLPPSLKLPSKEAPSLERNTTPPSPKPSQPAGPSAVSAARKTNAPAAKPVTPASTQPKK